MKTKTFTHDHRKIHADLYRMKPGPVRIHKMPALKYIAQEMKTAYRMDWAGRPEPLDEEWLVWKVVNQLKHITKTTLDYKFTLMPHEIIWHKRDSDKSIATQMMQVPDCITEEIFEQARKAVSKSLKRELPKMRLLTTESRLCALKLHVGHYYDTHQTLKEINKFMVQHGYHGKNGHREIYLTPAMKCHKPETWKTVVSVEVQ